MQLRLLRTTPHVCIYHDQANDWLFVDWLGQVDLPAVQLACLELAHVCLHRLYRRVLNNNAQARGATLDVPCWLANEFLPYLALAGVEQVAWVSGRSPRGFSVVEELIKRCPPLPITVFDDLELAVDWLRRTSPAPPAPGCAGPRRLPATQARLHQVVRDFSCRLLGLSRLQPV